MATIMYGGLTWDCHNERCGTSPCDSCRMKMEEARKANPAMFLSITELKEAPDEK